MSSAAEVDALLGAVVPLCAREIGPHAARWDSSGAIEPGFAARMSEWGLFGVSVPEAHGGAGAGMVGAAAVVEEIAGHSGSIALRLALHEAVAIGFALAIDDAELLAGLVGASAFVGYVGVGRGLAARQHGERTHFLGSSRMVPGDGALIACAATESGPVAGLIADDRVGARRFRVASGLRAMGWTDVTIDSDVQRTIDAAGVTRLEARLSVLVAATACGLARAATRRAVEYSRVRVQFGQSISQFQAIQWKLANSVTERDAAWLLVGKAAARLDANGDDAADAAARAQLAAVRAAVFACSEALQIHGGYGYTREFPIERMLRDARACTAIDRGDDDLRAALAPGIAARFA